jgi:uncharacterized protein (UPF0147 family)
MSVINYQEEYQKELKKNISLVRNKIGNADFVLKITNHAKKFSRNFKEVKDKIMNDDMYAEIFAKDPSKQNIYEKLAAKYISSLDEVSNFKNLPNNTKMFVVEGHIVNKRQNDVKSIDFHFKVGDKNIYASHKYIKATYGGAQDNQYNEVRNFLRNCKKINTGNDYYIAICDGPYFETKIETLNHDFGSNNVIAMNIDNLLNFIKSISS